MSQAVKVAPQSYPLDDVALRDAGYHLHGLRLYRRVGPVDPPHGNTGGSRPVDPLHITHLIPSQPFNVSIDALSISGALRPDFDDLEHVRGCVISPLLGALGFNVLSVGSAPCPADPFAVCIEASEYGARFYHESYDLAAYVQTPLGAMRVVLGWLKVRPRAKGQHHFSFQAMGGACRALGVSEGGESLRALYDFLEAANPALVAKEKLRIKRLDVALDDFKGALGGLTRFYDSALNGGFTIRGQTAHIETRGPAFHRWAPSLAGSISDRGSTLYMGKRTTGKFFRAYEKQKEQTAKGADPLLNELLNPEFRYEVEFKANGDYVIPAAALLCPLALWAGAWPALAAAASLVVAGVKPMSLDRSASPAVGVVGRALIRACRAAGELVRLARACNVPDSMICDALAVHDDFFVRSFDGLTPQHRRDVVHAFDMARRGLRLLVLGGAEYVPF